MTQAKRKRFTPPLAGFRGYKLSMVPEDLIAGLVIAALSIPIAMGYAEIAGLPPEYGLYASIVAPLAYALVTSTKRIVFGLDSATVAVTGSMIAAVGISLGTEQTIAVMPLICLLVAAFLMVFAIFRAGRLIRLIPMPVLHGFIFGVSITVILGQVPLLTATSPDMSGGFVSDVTNVLMALPGANIPSVIMAIICLAGLILIGKVAPRIPGALVVLLGAAVACAAFNLTEVGLVMLPAVEGAIPMPTMPDLTAADLTSVIICSFAIAIIVALESMLCLETFAMRTGVRADHDRELYSFGIAQAVVGIFGCPPCANSLSRTAAGISSGSQSQLASIFGAAIILLTCLFLSPYIALLPRVALATIVVLALWRLIDFKAIKRYASTAPYEFAVFCLSAFVVIFYGAIEGVIAGTILSVAIIFYRTHSAKSTEAIGAMKYFSSDDPILGTEIHTGYNVKVFRLFGHVNFLNIDKIIEEMDTEVTPDTEALILRISRVETLDATAADKLITQLQAYTARGIHVKISRKVRPVGDRSTLREMTNLMTLFKFYPNVEAARASLKREHDLGMDAQKPIDWVGGLVAKTGVHSILEGDRPIISITRHSLSGQRNRGDVHLDNPDLVGNIKFLQSKVTFRFQANYEEAKDLDNKEHPFTELLITDENQTTKIIEYKDGQWSNPDDVQNLLVMISPVASYMAMKLMNR